MPTFRYQEQHAEMTLAAGLEEYRTSFEGLVDEDKVSSKAAELFHAHDLCHVIFGCDTSVEQEAMVDTWTLFGSTISLTEYVGYLKVPEAREVVDEVGWMHTLLESIKATPRLIAVYRAARAMTEKWPFHGADAHLDETLAALRRKHGIVLV